MAPRVMVAAPAMRSVRFLPAWCALLGPMAVYACAAEPELPGLDDGGDAGTIARRRDAGSSGGGSDFLGAGPVSPAQGASADVDADDEPEDREARDRIDAGPAVPVAFQCSRNGSSADGVLVINEVDYDQPGMDEAEFIEIMNPSAKDTVDLTGYELVFLNGAQSGPKKDYAHYALSGTLAPRGYLVYAAAGVTVGAGARVVRFANINAIQNGPNDAIAIVKDGEVIDSLSYGGSLAEPCNFVEGTPAKAYDSNTITGALIRFPDGADTGDADKDWRFTATPTPGRANLLARP